MSDAVKDRSRAQEVISLKGTVTTPWWAVTAKWLLLLLALLVGLFAVQRLIEKGSWLGVVIVGAILMAILAVYSTRRAIPLKYLLPGLLLLLGLQIWPVVYTVSTAFTNYGFGHVLTKQQAIDAIVANSVQEVPGTPRYAMSVAVKKGTPPSTGDIHLLLTDPQNGTFFDGSKEGMKKLSPTGVQKTDSGKITTAPGFTLLTPREVNQRKDFGDFAVPTGKGTGIKPVGLSQAFEGRATVSYDAKTDTLTDGNGKQYVPKDAMFVPKNGHGDGFSQGWTENVGFRNFTTILSDPTIRKGFLSIFIWNVAFAAVSVLSTFFLGMLLALLLNDPRLRGKGLYRSLLILPYAIPGFVTALVWASMFNQDYGLINNLTHLNIDWLGNAWAARAAVLITNLWLGFPYMFIVCTGALQAIPSDVKEAALIDGANAFRTLRSITMPLLLVAVGPLLIASFAFNFNNFSLIFLLTSGGPFTAANTQIGGTDLLITYAYRLAISGVNPNYGLAAAVSIIIFFIVAVMSWSGFRRSKALEDIN